MTDTKPYVQMPRQKNIVPPAISEIISKAESLYPAKETYVDSEYFSINAEQTRKQKAFVQGALFIKDKINALHQ
jgi:hypothetical protein